MENDDILSKVDNLLKSIVEDPFAKINNLINMLETEPRSNYGNISFFESHQNDYGNIISVFSTILGCSIIQLDELVKRMIDITAIRKNEWENVHSSTQTPKRNRTIDAVENSCYHNTRFKPDELRTLKRHFFGSFQSEFIVIANNKFTYEETMIISLHYMAHGVTYYQLHNTYGGDWSTVGTV